MMHRTTTQPTSDNRFRILKLTLLLALGLMPLTVMAMAQSPEITQPPEEAPAESVPDESLDSESGDEGCPCCGRGGRGQGSRKGQGKVGHQGAGYGRRGQGQGKGQQGQRHGGAGQGSGRPEAQVIHFLIENHQSLERTVEEIPGGVRTRTVSQDPEIIDAVRIHVRQMVELIHGGGRIRNWDPLFREIFDHREAIEMEITDIEGGVEVTEISTDDQVARLIRAHAVKVEEFVARGLEAYREETPLPAEYSETSP